MNRRSFMQAVNHAAKLRGWHLESMGGGYFALCPGVKPVPEDEEGPSALAVWICPEEVAFRCGATDQITLKEAAERDGLKWNSKHDAKVPADLYAKHVTNKSH